MASFWSLWIIVLTSVTIVAMTWLLLGNRKRKEPTTEKTTGHNYDGIEELDNPLPAWWFYMFLITIVWGVGYLIIYPGMGNYPGLLGWTQVAQHDAEVAAEASGDDDQKGDDQHRRERYDDVRADRAEQIGELAGALEPERLVLSHNMERSLSRLEEGLEAIGQHYSGPVSVTMDLDCYAL